MNKGQAGGGQRHPRNDLGALSRLVSRNVGGLKGSEGRAASTTHSFLIFTLIATVAYTVFLMAYDYTGLGPTIAVTMVAAGGYGIGVVVVRLGHHTAAAVLAFLVAFAQIVIMVHTLGWPSGVHLYLIAGGQLVFMVFTERQRALRAVFVSMAAGAFLYSQLWVRIDHTLYAMPDNVLSVLFSVNAVTTAALMYVLAAFAHTRARAASALAERSAARAEYLANTDPLTGLSNRRPVMEHLELLGERHETRYCVALADLDHFKGLNDEFGHVCGDRVLATLGERLRAQVRPTDSVGRWGGEEFIFVMPDVDMADAVAMMERMRRVVGDHVVPCAGHSHHVTVSIGVSGRPVGAKAHRVIKRADDALYEAKLNGRDRVHSVRSVRADSARTGEDVPINPDGGEGHRVHRRDHQ
ncbi:MAG: GGDEF domain-containing protein [Demequina sp.]